ncbi:Fic family protein, partial [bacterium]|nr:Fic family protein [bacterium]
MMAEYVQERWIADPSTGMPRAERRSCEYLTYQPDFLADREFLLDGDVAADVADAETAIA